METAGVVLKAKVFSLLLVLAVVFQNEMKELPKKAGMRAVLTNYHSQVATNELWPTFPTCLSSRGGGS